MSTRTLGTLALSLCLSALSAPTAFAHVTLLQPQAEIGQHYRAVFTVPHGCEGSATTKLRISIPEGVIAVRPQPKAGWSIDIKRGPYDQSYTLYGNTLNEGVKEIRWEGGPLPDEHYDEFVLTTYLSEALSPDTNLYFPAIQECEVGAERWIDRPSNSTDPQEYSDYPAPTLRLLPKTP